MAITLDEKAGKQVVGGNNRNKLRGADVAMRIRASPGVPMLDALVLADKENLVMAPYWRIRLAIREDERERHLWTKQHAENLKLRGTKAGRYLSPIKYVYRSQYDGGWDLQVKDPKNFPCRSGTLVAYAEPGTAFNKSRLFSTAENALVYVDPRTKEEWAFPVPDENLELKDAILVAEHPNYQVEVSGKARIIHPMEMDALRPLPKADGRHYNSPDDEHCIPLHDPSTNNGIMLRRANGGRITLAVSDSRAGLDLTYWPSASLGMVVESNEHYDATQDLRNKKESYFKRFMQLLNDFAQPVCPG